MERKSFLKGIASIIVMLAICMILEGTAKAGVLTLPSSLKVIEAEAFYGDNSLEKIILPEGLTQIGSRAFADSSVKLIYLPPRLTSIAYDAFDGAGNVVGYGADNTPAAHYFESKGLPYINEIWFGSSTDVVDSGTDEMTIISQSQYGDLLNLKASAKLVAPSDGFYTFRAWNTRTDHEADIWLYEFGGGCIQKMAFPQKSIKPITYRTKVFPAGKELWYWIPANNQGNKIFPFGLKTIITFHPAPLPITHVSSIIIDDTDNYQFVFGENRQLTATIEPSDATNKDLLWVKDAGADGINIDANTGLVTATTGGRIKVHAEAKDGSGVVSDPFWLYCIPKQIPTLKVDRVGWTTIQLSWNEVPGAVGYRVRYKPISSEEWEGTLIYGAGNNSCDLKALLNKELNPNKDKAYDIKILAFSNTDNKTKSATEFSPVTTVNLMTENDLEQPTVSVKTRTSSSITLNLSAGNANTEFYYIEYYANKVDGEWQIENEIEDIPGDSKTYTIKGLLPNTKYYIDVYPETWDTGVSLNIYKSLSYTTAAGANAPNAPQNVTATAAGDGAIKLNWTASSDADGYYVRRSSTTATPITVSGRNNTSYTVSGLNSNTTYTFYVSAYKSSNSDESERMKVKATTSQSSVIPGKVTGVKQTASTTNSISLSWTAPSNAKTYEVYWRAATAGSGAWSSASASGTTYKITNLNTDNSYEVCVVGINGAERGEQSDSVSMSTTSSAVAVTSVSLSVTSSTLVIGGNSITLKETVFPSDAGNKNVTWTSSNSAVASVNNGVVTPLKAGSATITVKTVDGGKTATCKVTVIQEETRFTLSDVYAVLYDYTDGKTAFDISLGAATSKNDYVELTIAGNQAWSIKNNCNWLIPDKTSGSGNGKLKLTANENVSYRSLNGTIIFSVGGRTITANVYKPEWAAGLEMKVYHKNTSGETDVIIYESANDIVSADQTIVLGKNTSMADKYTLYIDSNFDWTVSSESDWFAVTPNQGTGSSGTTKVVMTFNGNLTSGSHFGKLNFTMGDTGKNIRLNVEKPSSLIKAPNVFCQENTQNRVTVKWNVVDGAYSYRVYYSESITRPSSFYASVDSSVILKDVTGLKPNTTYYFWVSAVDSAGQEAISSRLTQKTLENTWLQIRKKDNSYTGSSIDMGAGESVELVALLTNSSSQQVLDNSRVNWTTTGTEDQITVVDGMVRVLKNGCYKVTVTDKSNPSRTAFVWVEKQLEFVITDLFNGDNVKANYYNAIRSSNVVGKIELSKFDTKGYTREINVYSNTEWRIIEGSNPEITWSVKEGTAGNTKVTLTVTSDKTGSLYVQPELRFPSYSDFNRKIVISRSAVPSSSDNTYDVYELGSDGYYKAATYGFGYVGTGTTKKLLYRSHATLQFSQIHSTPLGHNWVTVSQTKQGNKTNVVFTVQEKATCNSNGIYNGVQLSKNRAGNYLWETDFTLSKTIGADTSNDTITIFQSAWKN